MSAFQTANYVEAGLWFLTGIGFLVHAGWPRTTKRTMLIIAVVTVLAFGISDVVETQTGAWWRPWWLLAWKAACVFAFLVLLFRYARRRKNQSSNGCS